MKIKMILSFILLGCCISACQKSPTYSEDTPPTAYRIDGITDLNLVSNYYTYLSLNITQVASTQEKVTLSLEGLPNGVTADISTTSGYPYFNSNLTFYDTSSTISVTEGAHAVKLVCTGSSTGRHAYSFNLIKPISPDCVKGSWFLKQFNNCSGAGNYYSDILTYNNEKNTFYFNNFLGNVGILKAKYNCNTNSFLIPTQTINGLTYTSGNGNMNVNTLEITGSVYVNGNYIQFYMN